VPCHHQIAIALKSPRFPIEFLRFASRWRIDYYKEEKKLKDDEILLKTGIEEVTIYFKSFNRFLGRKLHRKS